MPRSIEETLRFHRPQITDLDLENEKAVKFETYRYYVDCFCQIIEKHYPSFDVLVRAAFDNTKFMQGLKGYQKDLVSRYLMLSWNTEHLANLNNDANSELVRISNQWKVIQVYYSIYCACEAAAYLLDGSEAGGHAKCINKISDWLSKQPNLAPWNFVVTGAVGKSGKEASFRNFPEGLKIPKSNLQRTVLPSDMLAMCLQAEHRKRIQAYKKPKGGKKYEHNPGFTSILHLLYRLRILSNYKDVEIFLQDADERIIKRFSDGLSCISFFTNGLLEALIIRRIGNKDFFEIVNGFQKMNPGVKEICRRNNTYQKIIQN